MQTKYEKYEQLSHDTLHSISESKDNWLKFLDTASRMYKYSFDDQVLIHAQRPDTRACADFAFWTAENRMNRHIKRHSDGIALLDRDNMKLHYVYAVEDTEARANGKSRDPEAYIWQLSQENRAVINTMLCDQGNIKSDNIEKTIVSMAYSMARLKTADYADELDKMYDRLSPSLPREEFRTAFATFVAESSAYMAAKRTGTDVTEYLSKNQFANLYLFQNTYITGLVGEATADTAQAVLRQIERNVNEYKRLERSVGNGEYQREQRTKEESSERNTLRSGREDTDLSSIRGRERGGRTDSDRTLREAEGEISQGELQGNIQHDVAAQSADTTLESDRRSGVGEVRSDSEGISGSGRNGRGAEDERSARMGRSNEQLQGDSSGNRYQGDSGDRNRQYNISNEAEVINTSAFSYEEAIRSAFEEVSLNHSFSERQQKFLDRIENFAVRNNVTENIINTAFDRVKAFHSHYSNREYVSRNIFARRLGSLEKEIEEAIRKNTASVAAESNTLPLPDESRKYGTQSLVRTEMNGEVAYYKLSGMFLADIMSVAADSGSLQGYETIGTPIGENEFAEIEQSADLTFSVDLNSDEDTISIYTVNKGIGGIPEGERTDDNIRIENYKLSEYLHPNGEVELPIDTAKRLINEFCEQEYGSKADFSDISNINIAYTSIVEIDNVHLNDELELQVSVDLKNYAIYSYIDGDLVHSETYDSIEAMLPTLNNLDFNELTSIADYDEEIQSILVDKQAARAIDINEALADPIVSPEEKAELQRELDSMVENTDESVSEPISEQSIIERTERANAEKQTTTVKGNDLNIGDKVLWEGDSYIIESKGGLLGMKPLFETNVSIVSPSMIWQGMDFEVYEFAAPQQALASEFTEQEMLDVIGNYRYISTPKQDVVAHFNEHTDTDNRADYLRSIYNDDYSELIINDSRYGYKAQPDGLLLWKGSFLSSDEKQTISWDKVSELTVQLIDNEDFLGIDDIAETNDDMEQLSLFSDMSVEDEPTVHDTDEQTVQNDIAPTVQTEAEPTVQVEAPAVKKPVGDKKDFVITNENLGEGGAKTKYRANVAAIRTLKEIEAENRLATAAEQQILSQYVGWGGLKNAFEDFHDDWKNEYAELKELLTPEEYAAAAASVLNAHYTSPVVISAMYDALKENGFTGGRILEPAMGVGNFFGVMPTDIRDNSKLYGVELDSISGRIAQQLYQSANIKITGFEKTDIRNDTFDLAVGNVPFGGYSLNEAAYNRYHFQIHDHFFAKSLDKVKPNGIVAFITSKGTMDKNNPAIRKYIAERAELVGAIRLPNNAFKGNAGTEVTSDIIFLQKREYPIELTQDNMPSWIDLGKTEDGLTVNQYFIDNPDMVLGKIVEGNKLYGHGADDTMCIPVEGAVLKDQLAAAIKNIRFKAAAAEAETSEDIFDDDNIEIPLNVRNFSYAVIADNVYYRNNSDFEKFEGKKSDIPRIKGMIGIRDCLREVISCQIDNGSDVQLQALQEKLNSLYDSFVEKYGRLNTKQNIAAFKEDSAAPLLTSLEQYKGEEFIGKAAIFDKRTILAKTDVTSVDTASEALTLSLAKKAHVDMPYMQQLTGFTAEKIMEDLKGVVFENPMKMDDSGDPHLEAADEYLSGNIRKKLEFMKENFADDSRYAHNIEALEMAMPTRLQAADIDIKLGAPCVPKELVQQFMYESFGTPLYMQQTGYKDKDRIKVDYSELTSRWSIPNKRNDKDNAAANAKYGTKRKTAYEILEDCLNLQSSTVKDRVERDGKEVSVINQTETEFAQEKQKQLQDAFKQWIYAEPTRREEVVERYNVMFNSTRPREYDGSALEFPGMNNEIKLRKHQRDAVAHALYGGNTLFAHEVGAGKTFEMIAAAMEGKRLGLHNKALLCVPNHLTEQEGADFIKLYPNANILVATADDFSKKNRRRLFAKIATGDYDCVIIGHSQLINLPISKERQERLLNNQIDDIVAGIAALKAEKGDNFQIKQMEKTKKALQAKLEKLTEAPVRDDVVNFEELGIDKLIIDEAHMFKNLFISTKMSNISGISTNDNVQKTMDLYLKTQYLDEITGGKGTIFATGTPVSNSISEIYSMMKYLQNDLLEETGLKHFDMWAANFAETVTESQLSPEGNSYQMKTRFARFNNMPELMALFKECADIKTTDQLGLKIPECEMHTVVAQPSEIQKKLIENLSERAKRIRLRQVKPTEDNMPMITNDGRKIGLDVRLMNPDLPDDENSKLNVCINNVYNIWERTAEQKSTQVIFCDLGVPQSSTDEKKNGKKFSVYDDIKEKLIQKGVPAEEIAFIHSAKTEEAKDKLFAKVRKGEIRVLIGSTQKMGAGTNIQDKLIASHDLDAPWKPSDMEQRRGRMVRQGNENEKVDLYRYVTEGTFDAYLYQMLENKQKFISQIMTSKSPVRSCQDLDEVSLSYAEIKALSAGNPLIKEKMDLDIEVSKLKMLKASHMNALYDLQDKVMTDLPAKIKFSELLISNIEKDIKAYNERTIVLDDKGKPAFPSIELFGKVYTDKDEAGKALIEACRQAARADITRNVEVGSYQGFKLNIGYEPMNKVYVATLSGSSSYKTELGSSESGNFTRLDNALNGMEDKLTAAKQQLERLQNQLEEAKEQLDTPFPHEQELQEKSQRLDELTKQLESAADDKPTSELAEIVDPYFIEVSSEEAADKLKSSGITFEMKENEGHFIVKINRSDKDKVHDLLEQQKKIVL